MATEVIMPKLGLTMTEGTVIEWFKKEGEAVKAGEALLSVETDKVAIDVEAEVGGTLLKILVPAGQAVPITTVIGYVGEAGEKVPEHAAPTGQADVPLAPAISPQPVERKSETQDGSNPVSISPLARRLAKENNIDLSGVTGSGPQGRIVEADIQTLIQAQKTSTGSGTSVGVPFELQPLTQVKRVTARRMSESAQQIPHFYLNMEADCSRLVAAREKMQPEVEAQYHAHLTYTDFLLYALTQALVTNPRLNASWAEGEVRVFKEIHLGLAISTDQGLVVAVIHDCATMTIADFAREREGLAKKAREGKLTAEDIANGTFTLTNLGMFDIDSFQPIINPPQCAILAVGALKERPVVLNGQLAARPGMMLTLASDHRVVDGAEAASFLKQVVENLKSI